MISDDKNTEIFFQIDEFTKIFEPALRQSLIAQGKKTRNRPNKMSKSEVMTISVIYHVSGFKNLKHFYIFYVQKQMTKEFPEAVSYNRFVELM